MEKNNRNNPADKSSRHTPSNKNSRNSSGDNSGSSPQKDRRSGPAAPGSRPRPARKRPGTFFSRQVLGRRLLIIFLLSFFISTALIIYVFGMTADFFSRMFWCLLVVFLLSSLTALGIIPLVNRLMEKWSK